MPLGGLDNAANSAAIPAVVKHLRETWRAEVTDGVAVVEQVREQRHILHHVKCVRMQGRVPALVS